MKAKVFIAGMGTSLFLAGLAGLVVAWSGIVSVSAIGESGTLDRLLGYASSQSIHRHAGTQTNPFATDPEAVRTGLHHYKENCIACHAASGIDKAEFAQGLNPPPPKLTAPSIRDATDGELFWVIANGIRSTGMPAFAPTHSEEEIWKIVTFVRHLRELSADEIEQLKPANEGDESHHHDQSGH
ncbi:MAG: c-type cytochrome [Planctomycetes bacterium]|nr:c-type cytochrome [Planctomycetota bacterium]MCC7171206.1 c-type cytochrome [Planctomycetota bacterium]